MTDPRTLLLARVRAAGNPPDGFTAWLEHAPRDWPACYAAMPQPAWLLCTLDLAGCPRTLIDEAERRARAAGAEAELRTPRGQRVLRAAVEAEAVRGVVSAMTVSELLGAGRWLAAGAD